jgi:hypothetical protein
MARAKITGLGKSKGSVSSEMRLDDGDYLVEAQDGSWGESSNGDPMFKSKLFILDGPEQQDGADIQGKPWYVNLVIIEGHEYYDLMVDKLKNFLNAFEVAVRQDSFNEAEVPQKRAVMRIKNKADKKTGEMRSEIKEFFPVSDKKSPWKDADLASSKKSA